MAIRKADQIAARVAAARDGDHAAFGQLVRQFQDAVAGVALARCGPGPDVEDVAQETFVAAYRQLADLREPARFGAWVCGIARNLALRWVRDRRHDAPLPDDIEAPPASTGPDLADRVLAAVGALPDRLREPLALYYINGYTSDEVADLLELPAGTVRRRLHEARNQLREHMEVVVEDEIKDSAPQPEFAEGVLDRIAAVQLLDMQVDEDSRTILVTDEAGRSFPIFVGEREGRALAEGLGRTPPGPRPLLYDVLLAAAREFGIGIRGVRLTKLESYTFYARIDLATAAGQAVELDARPSDAINLAVRGGVGLEVVRDVTRLACPDFADPRPPGDVAGSFVSAADLREPVAANPDDHAARIDLGRFLVVGAMQASCVFPRPRSPETMAQQAAADLAEARQALTEVVEQTGAAGRRRYALLWLGVVAYLEADWIEAVAAWDRYDGPWRELEWSLPIQYATALSRSGRSRDEEVLARLADAVAAIDRMHGTDVASAPRLVARATLAMLAQSNLHRLAGTAA